MIQIREDIIESEKLARKSNPYFQGYEVISVPFQFDSKEVNEEELDNLFVCRLTEKMTDEFIEIISSQVW